MHPMAKATWPTEIVGSRSDPTAKELSCPKDGCFLKPSFTKTP